MNRLELKRLLLRPHLLIGFTVLLLTLLSFAGYVIGRYSRSLGRSHAKDSMPVSPTLPPEQKMKEVVDCFRPSQTVTEALLQHGLSSQEICEIVGRARPVYNLARVKARQPYWLDFTPEGKLRDFRYPVDGERYLTVYRDEEQNRYVPVMKKFPYETHVEQVSGAIEDSLFSAVLNLGEREQLALDLADIFGWDIDFYTDIKKGDSFRLLVEKKYLNGKFAKNGSILAAGITTLKRQLMGFRFGDGNGRSAYYAPDGRALKKSFLKSPLKFARISSKFSLARLHPILRIVRPHLGVDYAAPVGTPVQAVGAGIVVGAGQSGENGNMVRLRHAGNYETMYLHLSKITVRPGTRVGQGDLLGYVGSSGLSTGPHLDFRVLQRGRFINPAKVVFPPAPPVPPASFARFAALRDKLMNQLAQSGF